MNARRILMATAFSALALVGVVYSQNVPGPLPPEGEDQPEEEPEEESSSLQPRPDDDPQTEAWVDGLGAARPQPLTVERGVLLHHTLSPDGERFYYYRYQGDEGARENSPPGRRYALYTVGPGKSESKVADTGAASLPPLFLPDGRILFVERRYDMNDDGVLDELDEAALMVGDRDGGSLRHAGKLPALETPVATWREGREVLLSVPLEEEVNGWIVSMNLVSGERERICRGFNVELVLDDGTLLIEKQLAPEPEAEGQTARWGRQVELPEEQEPPEPSLLDHSAHFIFNPEDSTESRLYASNRRSRIVLAAEGSFFGHQEPDTTSRSPAWGPHGPESGGGGAELLFVDDAEHNDTRAPSARYHYRTIGWVEKRGLLAIEQGNLGSRLLLFDRAINDHRIADFELTARGFQASEDGLTIGWLEVEDTDKNGYLEPWKDHSKPWFFRIE